jgi:hypothetical protein
MALLVELVVVPRVDASKDVQQGDEVRMRWGLGENGVRMG